jgi:hypothetical protein
MAGMGTWTEPTSLQLHRRKAVSEVSIPQSCRPASLGIFAMEFYEAAVGDFTLSARYSPSRKKSFISLRPLAAVMPSFLLPSCRLTMIKMTVYLAATDSAEPTYLGSAHKLTEGASLGKFSPR